METEKKVDMSKVRYSHFRDGGHGLTIARVFDRDSKTVKFGWAANVPPRRGNWIEDGKLVTKKKGDIFCKKTGRKLAVQRLLENPCVVSLNGSDLPIVGALDHLISCKDEVPRHVKYLAELALDTQIQCFTYDELKLRKSASESLKKGDSFLDKFMQFLRGE